MEQCSKVEFVGVRFISLFLAILKFVFQIIEKFKHFLCKLLLSLAQLFSQEEARGTRFLFYPVFSSIGALTYFSCMDEPSFINCLLFVVLCCGLLFLSRHLRVFYICAIFFLCFSLGMLSGKIETMRVQTKMLGGDVSTDMIARVVSFEKTSSNRIRLLLDVHSTQNPTLRYGAERVQLSARSIPADLEIGDIIQGRVFLRAISGPVRKGNYDFAFHNYYRGIGAQGFFTSTPRKIDMKINTSWKQSLEISIARLRTHMTDKILSKLPGQEGTISAALITGQRGGISEQNNEALRISGLSHILSISGLHMAMVTGMVLVSIRAFLALFPVWSSRFSTKKVAAFIALWVSAFYLMLSGADVAAQRSFVMVAVMLIAILFNRAAITMHNLAISALVSIALVPHEVLGPSFQMSFAATAALIATFGWWVKRRKQKAHEQTPYGQKTPVFVVGGITHHIGKRIVFPVLSTAVASLVAGSASGIFAAYQFSNAAPLGIISNALAFPIMSIFVMPFALLAVVLMPFGLEWLPLQIMGWGVKIVLEIALWIAHISPDIAPGYISDPALILLTFGIVVLFFMQTSLRLSGFVLMFAGFVVIFSQTSPAILISQDGKLAAALLPDHQMALNNDRPNKFILKNWQQAYRIQTLVEPLKESLVIEENVFQCDGQGCEIKLTAETKINSTLDFVIINTPTQLSSICNDHTIVFLDFAMANKQFCNGAKAVITRHDLALYGMATLYQNGHIEWAIGKAMRPWNAQRVYSQQARSL